MLIFCPGISSLAPTNSSEQPFPDRNTNSPDEPVTGTGASMSSGVEVRESHPIRISRKNTSNDRDLNLLP